MPKACIHDNGEDRCVAEEGPHCICRLSSFVLSNGSSLALSVGRVIARLRRNYEKIITSDIDADSIVEMIYMDSANEG